jgi:small subunit ribosomal protein S1
VAAKKTRVRRRGGQPDAPDPSAQTESDATSLAEPQPARPGREVEEPARAPAAGASHSVGSQSARAPQAAAPVDDDVDFATMLEQSGGFQPLDVRVGDRVKVRLLSIGKEDAFFELGPGQDGVMSGAELRDDDGNLTAEVGDELELFVVSMGGTVGLSRKMGGGAVDIIALEQAKEAGAPLEGKVTGVNKGGLEVNLHGARGFCPLGQMDIERIEDPKELVGRTLTFLVTELKDGGKDVLLSRRAFLERERAQQAEQLLSELAVGQVRAGTVTRLTDFGAFVDLGGVDGLVPLGELSWGHVKSPDEVVSAGDRVTVTITKIEDDPKRPGRQRVGLSMRGAGDDPWISHASSLVLGAQLSGRVQRLESYGAFIELFDGVVGLAHISELSDRRLRHPSEVLAIGDAVSVHVREVDADKRRLSLSLREKVSPEDLPPSGTRTSATVTRIERYGVFVDLESGGSALLPASETGTEPGTDLRRALPIGTKLDVMIIDVDERGRVKVSHTAVERAEERASLDEYKEKSSGGSFGTFADLFKK